MEVNQKQTNATTKSFGNEESSTESEESQESIEQKVPDQLVMEFLINLMKKDFVVAEKLCKMILLYDPEHEQALSFQPLLQEMIEAIQDNAEDNAEDNTEDDSSESETEDSSESDSNETNSNSDTNSEESKSESSNQD